ncbi:MAG: hypothetical protein AMXMBFR83_13010 [Phycisphaerae bacterium]|jgi:hypothetical protein
MVWRICSTVGPAGRVEGAEAGADAGYVWAATITPNAVGSRNISGIARRAYWDGLEIIRYPRLFIGLKDYHK